MLPFLGSERGAPLAGPAPVHAPPPHFLPVGMLFHVRHYTPKPYVRGEGTTTAHKVGLRYEAAVQDWLYANLPPYDPTPSISFTDSASSRQRGAIPDAVLALPDFGFVFEIKHQHCPEAWWQTEKLYRPLLEQHFQRPFSSVEICHSYDPATPFPCPVTLISDLNDWVSKRREGYGVFQWRKS